MSTIPARTKWTTLAAVCRECDGKPKRVRGELKDAVKASHRNDVRVVMTSCQDVCPKHAVCVTIARPDGTSTVITKTAAGLVPLVLRLE